MTDYLRINRVTLYPEASAPTPDQVGRGVWWWWWWWGGPQTRWDGGGGWGGSPDQVGWGYCGGPQTRLTPPPGLTPFSPQVFGGVDVSPVYPGPSFDELDEALQNAW